MCGCLLHALYWARGPQPRQCALTGNGTRDTLVCSLCSVYCATPARAPNATFAQSKC